MNDNNGTPIFVTLIFWIIGLLIYFIPTAVASSRQHRNTSAIFVLNLFLGWSCLGWIGAAIWASTDNTHDSDR